MANDQSAAIDYRDLRSIGGTFSSLFVNFVTDYANVHQFYGGNFRDDAYWKSMLRRVVERPLDRSALVQILGERIGISIAVCGLLPTSMHC